jgi:hypothetical protein
MVASTCVGVLLYKRKHPAELSFVYRRHLFVSAMIPSDLQYDES